MTQVVLWSGGMDSTLLLRDKAFDFPNDMVNALTITSVNSEWGQAKEEKKTRRELKKKLPKNIKYHEVEVKTTFSSGTWQMPIWLGYLVPHINDKDVVSIGYLSSDGYDFWHSRENLLNAFKSHMKLMGHNKAELVFPFEANSKGWVIDRLKKIKLLRSCWYCGNPKKGKPCGKCMKCISFKRWSKFPEKGSFV